MQTGMWAIIIVECDSDYPSNAPLEENEANNEPPR